MTEQRNSPSPLDYYGDSHSDMNDEFWPENEPCDFYEGQTPYSTEIDETSTICMTPGESSHMSPTTSIDLLDESQGYLCDDEHPWGESYLIYAPYAQLHNGNTTTDSSQICMNPNEISLTHTEHLRINSSPVQGIINQSQGSTTPRKEGRQTPETKAEHEQYLSKPGTVTRTRKRRRKKVEEPLFCSECNRSFPKPWILQ